MTDARIHPESAGNGATEFDTAQARPSYRERISQYAGGLDQSPALNHAKEVALETYGQAIDALDRLVDRAPPSVQGHARSTLDLARRKPLLTTLAVAGVGLLLARAGRRR